MSINVTLLFQSVAFFIFAILTMKYVWPPIMKAMDDRRGKIADGLAAADKGAKALQEASAKSDEALKDARRQAQDILGSASKQAAQMVEQARTQAQTEGERIKTSAQAEIDREISQAREVLRKQVGELAVVGAAQILKREINAQAHADVLSALAAKI
jgi:F-type H+-transporting ATPase subunit b